MVFSSAIFLFAFLPLCYLLTHLTKSLRAQNCVLAAASLVFYAFGQLQYVPLFLASVLVNYLAGLLLTGRFKKSRAVLALAVALNLTVLGVFKYTDFVLQNLNAALRLSLPMTGIVLPIGISFFTFQGLSYVIDSYRDPESGTRDFLKLLLYIAFFPQLIAGPIVKYHDIAAQIDRRVMTPEESAAGIRRFIRGLAKKLLIADTVGYLADAAYATLSGTPDTRVMWLGALCYTLQIYYDFSGYSDMAIGMGHMFGFRFHENFNYPYAASSLKDFWRRWHISLSGRQPQGARSRGAQPLCGLPLYRHLARRELDLCLLGACPRASLQRGGLGADPDEKALAKALGARALPGVHDALRDAAVRHLPRRHALRRLSSDRLALHRHAHRRGKPAACKAPLPRRRAHGSARAAALRQSRAEKSREAVPSRSPGRRAEPRAALSLYAVPLQGGLPSLHLFPILI